MSKPKHDTRVLCITRSINVCKQMIRFKRSSQLVTSLFKKRRAEHEQTQANPSMIHEYYVLLVL